MEGGYAAFLSRDNAGALLAHAEERLRDMGIDPEDPRAPLREYLFRAMTETEGMIPESAISDKNRTSLGIVLNMYAGMSASPPGASPQSDHDPPPGHPGAGDLGAGGGVERELARGAEQVFRGSSLIRDSETGASMMIGRDSRSYEVDPGLRPSERGDGRSRVSDRYIVVNGGDRDTASYPQRCWFRVDLRDAGRPWPHIRSVEATRMVIPREVSDPRSVTNTSAAKVHYTHNYGLAHQYLGLEVAELQGTTRGSSLSASRCIAHFVSDGSYTSENGRDFLILKPMSQEVVCFESPLPPISHMTLRVVQPNGEILNESSDPLKVTSVRYEAATVTLSPNTDRISITVSSFFDINEFYTGDRVRLYGFRIPNDRSGVEEFINRPSGHTVIQAPLQTATTGSFSRTIHIPVPGKIQNDPALGQARFVPESAMITDLAALQAAIDDKKAGNPTDYFLAPDGTDTYDQGTFDPDDLAKLVNTSLQVCVSFRVGVEVQDA
jgi:hypothetical protein